MDVLSGMKAFVATVDSGSFSQAARDLGASKATVSKQVAALEDHLQVRLLHRTTRKLNLTDEGRDYVDRARRILEDMADAEDAISPHGQEPRGRLRLSVPTSFGTIHLTNALAAFLDRYPLITLDVEFSDRFVNLVEESFDAVIRISQMRDSTLIARHLAPVKMALSAAPEYWAKHGKPSHPRELADHNCIIYTHLATPGEWTFVENAKPFNVKVSGHLNTNNDVMIRTAAVQGCGIVYGPSYIFSRALHQGQLEAILDDFCADSFNVYAVYPSSRNLSPKVRAFIDFLVEWFRHTPNWDDACAEDKSP